MLTAVAIVLAVFVLPPPWGVAAVAAAAAVDVAETAYLIRRTRRRRSAVGSESFVGRPAVVAVRLAPTGRVRIDGESWAATLATGNVAEPGEMVEVLRVEDLLLVVRPARLT